jgi:hypothetical protein
MAYSDFDFFSSLSNSGGNAFLNSGLSNPLPASSQVYCRELVPTGVGGHQNDGYIKSTSYGGAFFGIPNTRAVTARASLRMGLTDTLRTVRLWAVVKNSTIGGTGYTIGLYAQPGLSSSRICLGYEDSVFGTPSSYTLLTTIPNHTWTSVRLDVFPQGAAADVLQVYSETSPGSGSWTLLHTETVLSSSPRYAPWGGSRYCGWENGTSQSANGANPCYIDDLYFAVKVYPP